MDPKENLVMLAAALLWMVISAETSQATHLPGCQDKCGDVSIPYPFGTSEGCYFNEHFRITCDTAVTPPIPYLWSSNLQVLSISLDGHLRILTYVGADCYSKSGARESPTGSYAVLPAFPFSNTRNKFFDVDECQDSNRNKCLKKCHNTIGNYTCPCPKGYHGDGRKDGEGCSADQLLLVKIFVGKQASTLNVSHESSPPITFFSEIFALLLIMMPSISDNDERKCFIKVCMLLN
ncbi:WALL-ASSOCIATED RECEPTOR KINASE 2-LIKE ISOFORM X2 [Salix koriyanagi]|uniref:WALL-ASSOCIATED RECEPTOR KINASE 2-LIKE ISOFORM X2 n=1 Tax=Salix koriyanagi TaxID=2511006 RepID=A0A9Q0TCQ6_9ROSI|nr:WALL-ASSOCIATED RECEPTOR KINASE 2-LIKE ISOFORM X2 [Salix koriyanagi]